MNFEVKEDRSLAERIAAALADRIISGVIAPGSGCVRTTSPPNSARAMCRYARRSGGWKRKGWPWWNREGACGRRRSSRRTC